MYLRAAASESIKAPAMTTQWTHINRIFLTFPILACLETRAVAKSIDPKFTSYDSKSVMKGRELFPTQVQ